MTVTVRCPQAPCPASQGRKLVDREGRRAVRERQTGEREERVGCAGRGGAWAPVPETKVQWAFVCLVEPDRGHPAPQPWTPAGRAQAQAASQASCVCWG